MVKNRLLLKREVATYAEVLLEEAKNAGNVFEVSGQLKEIQAAILRHPSLREMLRDDQIVTSDRVKVLQGVFPGADPAIINVLAVMSDRGDMRLLHQFVEEYNTRAEQTLDAVIIDVTTVVELDDMLREKIKSKFSAQFGRDVLLREHIDVSILGGIVLSAHGQRIDASIATQLEKVRIALSSSKFGGER